jgi:ribonuclease HI
MAEKSVIIYTDGACEPNPGPGGYGVVLIFDGKIKKYSQGYFQTTNNRMEIMAAIAALEALKITTSVTIYSDSKYLVNAITQGWARSWKESGWLRKGGKNIPNSDLWDRLLQLDEMHNVTYLWVKGHSGNRFNEVADALSYEAIERGDKIEDEGYLKQMIDGKETPSKITEEGQPCRKCSTPVVRRIPDRKRKKGQAYYFEYYLYCPQCGTRYLVEDAKRYFKQDSLFSE